MSSIAGLDHDNKREIERHRRQSERNTMRQASRAWVKCTGDRENGYMSRRGRWSSEPL